MKNNQEQPLVWNGIPVLTTRMLAERLGITEKNLSNNYLNNKQWYSDDDIIIVKGAELKQLKKELVLFNRGSHQLEKTAKHAYLWTEGGAHNQAKTAETPQAWEAFLYLKNNYFIYRKVVQALKDVVQHPLFPHTTRPVQIENSKAANKRSYEEGGVEQLKEYNFKSCLMHSGKTTNQVKAEGLKTGLGKSICKNAKEVLRKLYPAVASSMSITDDLYKMGASLEEIAPLSVQAQPLLAKMHQYGLLATKKISR